jgi:hypothetical protein
MAVEGKQIFKTSSDKRWRGIFNFVLVLMQKH